MRRKLQKFVNAKYLPRVHRVVIPLLIQLTVSRAGGFMDLRRVFLMPQVIVLWVRLSICLRRASVRLIVHYQFVEQLRQLQFQHFQVLILPTVVSMSELAAAEGAGAMMAGI